MRRLKWYLWINITKNSVLAMVWLYNKISDILDYQNKENVSAYVNQTIEDKNKLLKDQEEKIYDMEMKSQQMLYQLLHGLVNKRSHKRTSDG